MSKIEGGLFLALVLSLATLSTAANVTAAPTTMAKSDDGLMVDCTSNKMVAILDLKKYSYLETDTMTLADTSCKPKEVNSTHAVFHVPLDGCSTTYNSSKEYLMYYNSILITKKRRENDTIITREHNVTFNFNCAYDRSIILSVVSFSPRRKRLYTKAADFGNFTFTMDMFKSDKYEEAHDTYPVLQYIGSPMYIQVAAIAKDSELVLFPERCFATPTSDVNSATFYNFIDKGCSKDDTLKYKYDKESSKQQFSLDAFRFIKINTDQIHLHCDVIVCRKSDSDSVCAKGCQKVSRKRRAVVGGAVKEQLTLGPVQFAQVQAASGAVAKGPFTVTTVAAIAGCLALLAVVLVAAIVMVIYRRRAPRGGKPNLLVQEE